MSRTEARILEWHLFAVNGQFGEVQWEWAADPCVSGFMISRGVVRDPMGGDKEGCNDTQRSLDWHQIIHSIHVEEKVKPRRGSMDGQVRCKSGRPAGCGRCGKSRIPQVPTIHTQVRKHGDEGFRGYPDFIRT